MNRELFFLLLLLSASVGVSQNIQLQLPVHCEAYICKNPNNTTEILYISSMENKKIYYTHSNQPNKVIPLKIIEYKTYTENEDITVIWVQFPNSPAKYKLESRGIVEPVITCTNPDGSVQTFVGFERMAGAYGTYRKQDGSAYMYIENIGSGKIRVKYASKQDGFKWQNLIVENAEVGDMGHLKRCSVRFPLIKEDEYNLEVEANIEKPYTYEIKLQHASMTEEPEIYYWINK